jgi:predicted ATP-dependent endonuclease of OLD family
MKVKSVYIKNFRGIQEQQFSLNDLSILIGNNGTGKTSVLEAIHFALSPYFISGRIKHTDFSNGSDEPIIFEIEFSAEFEAELPDGFTTQKVNCNKVRLEIKKRDKATPNKAFSDGFVTNHYVVPVQEKNSEKGWSVKRKNGSSYDFTERTLSLGNVQLKDFPRSFYFNKKREQQIKKGYNSSITSVFDDFNWRFLKGLRKEDSPEGEHNLITRKTVFENEIMSLVDEAVVKKSFQALNEKLKAFGIDETRLSIFDSSAPFDSAFISREIGTLNVSTNSLGSGVEMIISLLFLETLASLSKEQIIIFIDEPELHLHPQLQEAFVQYLHTLSSEKQIILSTHSPFFYKNCLGKSNIELIVTKCDDKKCIIDNSTELLKTFPWSPSWGEINYFAYNLPTLEFHNELYGYLQEQNQAFLQKDIEQYFVTKGISANTNWIRINKDGSQQTETVTAMTYIRNYIHHPENTNNPPYTHDEINNSIEIMLGLIE